jgi:hypothetical protein
MLPGFTVQGWNLNFCLFQRWWKAKVEMLLIARWN